MLNRKIIVPITAATGLVIALILGVGLVVGAPDTAIRWSVFGSGGGTTSSSTSYALGSTAGQPAIGSAGSAGFQLGAGFWYLCNGIAPDNDCDAFTTAIETACGSNPNDPASVPERLDGAFALSDNDGDTMVDEALPGGSENFDCDGDGYRGDGPGVGNISERRMYGAAGTANDQDACGSSGWPADLASGGTSANRITLTDLSSFIAPPPRKLGTDPGDAGYDVRWDLVTGNGVGAPKDIILTDMSNITTLFPPMLGGVKAFGGPVCPWPP